ncbi:acetate--CoA ligase family protein [Pseudonocardia nigra]|uniref:acetate--CoA ligase family protein n=1 Tax=Pseudonocardia nigra TaxID=1921578 RepID=UPI001C5F22AD|nr:acetate--CoA ligase [Pseudonocardia nigra]
MLRPRGVALVGVSGRPGNPMARPLRYLREHGFGGGIYPVNPGYDELEGLPCYGSLGEVPGPVDLVLALVPAAKAVAAVHEAGAVGAAGVVVFASGFAETGTAGARLQADLVAAGREAGVRVLGPNCQGLLHAPTGLVATFTAAADRPLVPAGGVAYVGQSGAVGGSILDLSSEMGLGLTAWVSTGNQADLDLVEVASALLDEPDVRVLLLYVESVGDGADYLRVARRARDAGKHLVVLRSGRSTAGRRAAASHTGSMLGDDAAFVLASARHGVVLVDDVDELLGVAATLASMPRPEGRRVAVVTTSGGAGSLAADRCSDADLDLPELRAATQDRLRPLIPAFGALANPVDVTAQLFTRGAHAFGDVCRIVADDPGVDAVAVVLTMVVGQAGAALAEDLVGASAKLAKPLMVAWLAGQEQTAEGRAVFRAAGIPVFRSVGDLARAAGLVAPPRAPGTPPAALPRPAAPSPDRIRELLGARDGQPDEPALLDAMGVDRPASVVVRSRQEAADAVAGLGGPAAMKLQAGALAHKSDVGGVRLGVDAADAAEVFDELLTAARAHHVEAVDGVLVQAMIPAGLELVVAATGGRDGFPPLVTVGFGGITTEIYSDVASGLAPVPPEEAWAMLRSLRAWPLLAGFRGAPPRDVHAAVDAVVRVGHAAVAAGPRLAEFEVNPLVVGLRGEGATAVDVLVRTAEGGVPVGE